MKHPIRRWFMYLGFRLMQAIISFLPLSVVQVIGSMVGSIAFIMLNKYRKLSLVHINEVFGDSKTDVQKRQIARESFINLGKTVLEWFVLSRYKPLDLQKIITTEGVEHIEKALAKGNGVIGVSGHLGNWELVPTYLSSLGFGGVVVARRLRYPEYESFLISMRERFGVKTHARGGGSRELAKFLRANKVVGILADQDIESIEGVFVDFLGRSAHTPVGPAALSLITGAPIIPCMMIREGKTFRLVIQPPISITQTADRKLALRELTQKWSDAIANHILCYPEQWVWMHKRWKTQPNQSQEKQSTSNEDRKSPSAEGRSGSRLALTALVGIMCGMFYTGSLNDNVILTTSVISEAVETNSSIDGVDEMDGFALAEHVDGIKQWELNGDNAIIDGDLVTVFKPNGVGYDKDRTVYLTASLALIDQATRRMRLEHNVTVHTTDGIWIFTPILYWDSRQDTFFTDSPVRVETDNLLLMGRQADGQMNDKSITLHHDVELIFSPEPDQTQQNQDSLEKHVIITCEGSLTLDYKHFVVTFEDNVHVDDPSGDLYSDKLVAYLDQTTHAIRFADATGNVRIEQAGNVALSDRAVYQPGLGKISLAGGRPTLVITPSDRPNVARIPLGGFTTIGTTKTP